MAKLQYALVTSSVSPYARMIKFLDGVPSVLAIPAQSSPIALGKAAASPDGKYFLTAGTASLTTPFRMWKMVNIDEFVTVDVAALSLAGVITDIAWMTNTHIVATNSTNGLWFGVLDRTTDTITWTRTNTDVSLLNVAVSADGEFCYTSRTSATPYYRMYKRTGDTLAIQAITHSQSVNVSTGVFSSNDLFAQVRPANAAPISFHRWDEAGLAMLSAGTYITFASTDQPTTSTSVATSRIAWTPDGRQLVYSTDVAPRLGMIRRVTNVAPLRFIRGDAPTFTTLPNTANAIAVLNASLILVAVASSTITSGRVRGFSYNDVDEALVEVSAISALFNDWNATPADIAHSPEIEGGAASFLYYSAIESMMADTLNLSNLKMALVSTAAVFDPAHTTLAAALGADEVTGSDWPAGGIAVGVASYEKVGTGYDYAIKFAIPNTDLASPGTLNFGGAIIYDDASVGKKPFGFIRFATEQSATQFDRMIFSSTGNRFAIGTSQAS